MSANRKTSTAQRAANARWQAKNPERYRASVRNAAKAWELRHRFEALSHYSNGSMTCACCADSYEPHLTLDHIHGGGGEERRVLRKRGARFYFWLKQHGWPEGFRVLCLNCNVDAHHRGGECGCQTREAQTA